VNPHQQEFAGLKAIAALAANKKETHEQVAGEIARYFVSEMRRFGSTDGALCAWAGIPGFGHHREEFAACQKQGRILNLGVEIDALVRIARLPCQPSRQPSRTPMLSCSISCHHLAKAMRIEILRSTATFRAPIEAAIKEREREATEAKQRRKAKEQEVPFYTPQKTPDDGSRIVRRPWV